MYNTTVVTHDNEGRTVSRFVAEVRDGRIVRSSAMWSPLNGTHAYEDALRGAVLGSLGRVDWTLIPGTQAMRDALTGTPA